LPKYKDQTGFEINLEKPPVRIVSLVPSQTELLWFLGLEDAVKGITTFCVHPESWYRSKTRVGGTKNPDLEKILDLQPDLIIANKEENVKEHLEHLRQKVPVWTSDVNTFEDALEMINETGKITRTEKKARKLAEDISEAFARPVFSKPRSFIYLIWQNPYMAAGRNTFISSFLEKAGLRNALPGISNDNRYPELSLDQIQQSEADLVFFSTEPFPFKPSHLEELKELLSPKSLFLIDGEFCSWYGCRMLQAGDYFRDFNLLIQANPPRK
jgi:ABC-type Fe3+-hydroxamate transport system substrate-binding protein